MKNKKSLFNSQDMIIRPGKESQHTVKDKQYSDEVRHTPTPWEVVPGTATVRTSYRESEIGKKTNHMLIASFDKYLSLTYEERIANAAFLVRAVNAYQPMSEERYYEILSKINAQLSHQRRNQI